MKLRDLLNSKIQEAYKQPKAHVQIRQHLDQGMICVDIDYNGATNMRFVGNVNIRCSFGSSDGIYCNGETMIVPPHFSHFYYTQNIPVNNTLINTILNEVEPILDIVPQITSYKNNSASYINQNASITQSINSINQRTTDFQMQASRLQSQVNSFQISDTTKTLNAKQKAHILQKIWGSSDGDSTSIINAVKQSGFDPHYVHKNGQSLLTLAFSRNDAALFDLLIANKMDFNSCIGNKSAFQIVLASNNAALTSKMFATNQDFSKSVLDIALNDDAAMLGKIFSHKPALSKVSYSGYSLLQLALKKGSHNAAEQILKASTDSITQLSSNGLSSLQLCLLWSNGQGIELLKKYGANIEVELKIAIDKRYSNIINKILEVEPELINKLNNDGKSPLYYALEQNKAQIAEALLGKGADSKVVLKKALAENNIRIIKDLTTLNPESNKVEIDSSKNILYLALEQDKVEITKMLLESSEDKDLLSIIKLASVKGQSNVIIKLAELKPDILAKLTNIENNQITEELLKVPEAVNITNDNGDNLLNLACKSGNYQLATAILARNPLCINEQNKAGKTAFHILLESSLGSPIKAQFAELFLKHHPNVNLSDTQHHTVTDLATEYDPNILTMLYEQNLIGENNPVEL